MPLFYILSGYTAKPLTTWSKFWSSTKKSFRKVWLVAALMVMLLSIEFEIFNHQPLLMMIKQVIVGIFGDRIPLIMDRWLLEMLG